MSSPFLNITHPQEVQCVVVPLIFFFLQICSSQMQRRSNFDQQSLISDFLHIVRARAASIAIHKALQTPLRTSTVTNEFASRSGWVGAEAHFGLFYGGDICSDLSVLSCSSTQPGILSILVAPKMFNAAIKAPAHLSECTLIPKTVELG